MSLARDIADLGSVTARLDTVGGSGGALSNRNLIINGSQIVNQRGTQTVSASATTQFGPDRFKLITSGLDNFVGTIAQDSDVPSGSGFANSLKITTTTAESAIDAPEYFYLNHTIEAQNLQQLAYGTSSAKEVTLSFWVKSTITGTFAVGLYKPDSTTHIHVKTYTINDASTWEYKTITFGANALSGGAIANDNGSGIEVAWHLAVGSNFKGTDTSSGWASYSNASWGNGQGTDAVITTTNATFQITGAQLEVGSTATDFEHRSFGDELLRCQRYYQETSNATNYSMVGDGTCQASNASILFDYLCEMRTAPSISALGANGSSSWYIQSGATIISTANSAFSGAWASGTNSQRSWMDWSGISGHTAGNTVAVYRNNQSTSNKNACLAFDAEL